MALIYADDSAVQFSGDVCDVLLSRIPNALAQSCETLRATLKQLLISTRGSKVLVPAAFGTVYLVIQYLNGFLESVQPAQSAAYPLIFE